MVNMINQRDKPRLKTTFEKHVLFITIISIFISFIGFQFAHFKIGEGNFRNRIGDLGRSIATSLKPELDSGDIWSIRKSLAAFQSANVFEYAQIRSILSNEEILYLPFVPVDMREGQNEFYFVTEVINSTNLKDRWELILLFNKNRFTFWQNFGLALIITAPFIFLLAVVIFLTGRRFGKKITDEFTYLGVSISQLNLVSEIFVDHNRVFTYEGNQILSKLKEISKKLLDASAKEQIFLKSKAFSELASQVAHDIRSPLSALSMVMKSANSLPEEQRLMIRNATQRINDIANGLLKAGKLESSLNVSGAMRGLDSNENQPVMLMALIDSIVSEKRIQFIEKSEIEILENLTEGYGLFARINSLDLGRAISNLINNSVESFDKRGTVKVPLHGEREKIFISIVDNGKGIPPDVLKTVGERGLSYGKSGLNSGSGFGFYHARETIQSAGGKINLSSTVGEGTKVTIELPKAARPHWFVDKIVVPENATIVSVDDDQTIHQIWSGKLSSAGAQKSNVNHVCISSIEKFVEWAQENKTNVFLFLIDYEFLGQNINGLDGIERAKISTKSILVTSRYEELPIRNRCASFNVKIIPKGLAPYIPLTIGSPFSKVDAVLIDDDRLVHMTWQFMADEKSKSLMCFEAPEDFLKIANQIPQTTPIYIDYNLSNNVRGDAVAEEVARLGFSEIYLATGFEANDILKPNCVKGIIGKNPVF